MVLRWASRFALLGLSIGFPAVLAAHGGDAKVVRVAALDGDGAPWLLQLSEGLAIRDPHGFRFLCPAALEAPAVLHARSSSGDTAWAATLRGVFRITPAGAVERIGEPCGDYPGKLVAHRDAVYLLARDGGRSQSIVCALEAGGPREIYASDTAIEDLASDGARLWLARSVLGGLELESIDDGARRTYSGLAPHRGLRVIAADGALYATLIDIERSTLVRLLPDRAETVLESTGLVVGPVESDGTVFAGADGRLIAIDGARLSPIDAALHVDGMDSLGGHGFAFSDGRVYDLPLAAAGVREPLFTLDGLGPPAPSPFEECGFQWQRLERDLHASDHASSALDAADAAVPERDAAVDGVAAPTGAPGGCSMRTPALQRPQRVLTAWLAFALLVRRCRRRPGASGRTQPAASLRQGPGVHPRFVRGRSPNPVSPITACVRSALAARVGSSRSAACGGSAFGGSMQVRECSGRAVSMRGWRSISGSCGPRARAGALPVFRLRAQPRRSRAKTPRRI